MSQLSVSGVITASAYAARRIEVKSRASINSLSDSMLGCIFQYMRFAELSFCRGVSRQWKRITVNRQVRDFLHRQFPSAYKTDDCSMQRWLIEKHKQLIFENMSKLRCHRYVTELFKDPQGQLLCAPIAQEGCKSSGSLIFYGGTFTQKAPESQADKCFFKVHRLSLSDGAIKTVNCAMRPDAAYLFTAIETIDREFYLSIISRKRTLLECLHGNIESTEKAVALEFARDIQHNQICFSDERIAVLEKNTIWVWNSRFSKVQCQIDIPCVFLVQKKTLSRISASWLPVDIKMNSRFLFVMMRGQNDIAGCRDDKLLVFDLKNSNKPPNHYLSSAPFSSANPVMHLTENFLVMFVPGYLGIDILSLREPKSQGYIKPNAAVTQRSLDIQARSSVPAKGPAEFGKTAHDFIGCTSLGDILVVTMFGNTRIYDLRLKKNAHIATLRHPFTEFYYTGLFDGKLHVAGVRVDGQGRKFQEREVWDFSSMTPGPVPEEHSWLQKFWHTYFSEEL